jgi:predicted nucleotidyltransferase
VKGLYKRTLSPKFWRSYEFDKNIRRKILKIVDNFLKEFDYKIDVEDIRLTGSIANFTYNKYSDLDIHIIADFSKINKDKNLVKEALDGKRFIWNLRHDIYLKGHEVELYFEDINEQHISAGIFSLKDNEWVKQPQYNPPESIDTSEIKFKVRMVADLVSRMEKALETTTDKNEFKLIYNKAKKIKNKIVSVRKDALKENGEFATENLIFKKLRNMDIIEKIIEVINNSYDKFFMESFSFNKTVAQLIK